MSLCPAAEQAAILVKRGVESNQPPPRTDPLQTHTLGYTFAEGGVCLVNKHLQQPWLNWVEGLVIKWI